MSSHEKALRILRTKAADVLSLAVSLQEGTVSGRKEPDFAYMSFLFLKKQTEHMRGVLALADAGLYRDCGLIARSMLEGRAQLLWAGQEPDNRPRQWMEFWPVSDWRKMKKLKKAGRSVPSSTEARIEKARGALGDKYLKPTGVERRKNGQCLRSKDYWENWTGKSYSEVLDLCVGETEQGDVQEHLLKLATYGPLSAWHHWDIGGFAEAVRTASTDEASTYSYDGPSLRAGAEALAVAFQCLLQTLLAIEEHFVPGIRDNLETLLSDYLSALRGLNEAAGVEHVSASR